MRKSKILAILLTQRFAIALINILGIMPASPVLADIQVLPSPELAKIARDSGLSSPTITVCNLAKKCLSYRGDRNPRSAASLIKLPIAIALLHKLAAQNISLSKSLYVHPSNFTEEDYSDIQVGRSYPFRYLLTQMIAYSSNIATNQIIDYLGWNYINQVLRNLGYSRTRVAYKFTGEFTSPRRNRGWASNLITSNELSAMMVQIYNRNPTQYEVLIDILRRQADRELGIQALSRSTSRWLGEKTGENSRVRGSTLAVQIKRKTYIITVTEDAGKTETKLRQAIVKIVNYIDKNQLFN